MARDISVIYGEIIDTKNSRSELIGLSSTSQTAIYKLWAYITAVAIYTHELLFDLFRDEIELTLDSRINGTSPWYAQKALEYQKGDDLLVLGGGTYLGYDPILEDNRIITRCSYSESTIDGAAALSLKVAQGEVGSLSPLSTNDKDGVASYFEKLKFAGTYINIISIQADDIVLNDVYVYHDGVRTGNQIRSDVDDAMNSYLENLPFDGMFYVEQLRDSMQDVDNIVDVDIRLLERISYIDPNNPSNSEINRRVSLDAGHAKISPEITYTIVVE